MAAKKTQTVRLRIRTSFNDVYEGDESDVVLDDRVRGWIEAGLAEVISGKDSAGPGGAEPGHHERVPDGAAGSGASGGEPSQGFGTGGYGTSARVHQG